MLKPIYIAFLWIFLFGTISLMANANGIGPEDPAKADVEELSECCKKLFKGEIIKECSIEDLIICLQQRETPIERPNNKPKANTRVVLVSK